MSKKNKVSRWQTRSKELQKRLDSIGVPFDPLSQIAKAYVSKILRSYLKRRELEQLRLFWSKGSERISDKCLEMTAAWCNELFRLMAGNYAVTANLLDLSIPQVEIDQMLEEKMKASKRLKLLTPGIKQNDLLTTYRTLMQLRTFRSDLRKRRDIISSRKIESGMMKDPLVGAFMYELVMYIDQIINPEHGGVFKNEYVEGQQKKVCGESYMLTGKLLQLFLRLSQTPTPKQVQARVRKYLSHSSKYKHR